MRIICIRKNKLESLINNVIFLQRNVYIEIYVNIYQFTSTNLFLLSCFLHFLSLHNSVNASAVCCRVNDSLTSSIIAPRRRDMKNVKLHS